MMRISRPLTVIACAIAVGIIVLALWRLAASLAINSFWQDELFSMNLAQVPHFAQMLRSAASDTHPPTFYALLWGWTRLSGFGEVGARLLPMLCSIGLLTAILLLPRPGIGVLPRLFVAALVATSHFWNEHAGEVRSYALAALLLAIAALASSRIVAAPDRARKWQITLVLSATLAAASHLFALYGATWLALALVAVRPGQWRTSLGVIAGVALAGAAYSAQILLFHDFGNSGLLFAPTPAFLLNHVMIGLRSAGLPLLLGCAMLAVLARLGNITRRGFSDEADRAATLHDIALLAGPVAVTLAGLLVTLIVPSLNYRGPQLGLALGWCGLIGLIDRTTRDFPRVAPAALLAALAATGAWLLSWQGLRPLPSRPDFRELARQLAAQPDCAGAVIPVLRDVDAAEDIASDGTGMRTLLRERFGYYDTAGQRFEPFTLVRGEYHAEIAPRGLLAARIVGRDACRVIAVTADVRGYPAARIERALRTSIADSGGDPTRLQAHWLLWYVDAHPDQPVRSIALFSLRR
jgi:hypothetical protein